MSGFETERMTQAECVIFVGLQASGKAAFYRLRFASTHEHISKDNFPHATHYYSMGYILRAVPP